MAAYDYEVIRPLEAPEGLSPGDECWAEGHKGNSDTYGVPNNMVSLWYSIEMGVDGTNTTSWIEMFDDGSTVARKLVCNDKPVVVYDLKDREWAYIIALGMF